MKTYPKVPRYRHEVIPEDFYTQEDLSILEKVDGQNFRIILFDSRYRDSYPEEILSFNPEEGDIFIGTKNSIQGRVSSDSIPGNLKRVQSHISENMQIQELRELHTKYNSPLLLFGEHIVKHTKDYNYNTSPPPAIVGFDVFRLSYDVEQVLTDSVEKKLEKVPFTVVRSLIEEVLFTLEFKTGLEYNTANPSAPYEEIFEGFLSLSETEEVFNKIGLDMIHIIDRDPSTPLDPTDIEIPRSKYGDVSAEGVVFRSDLLNRRAKMVSPEFKEAMKDYWGLREDQAETGEELVASWFLTNGRIRKYIHKLLNSGESVSPDELAEQIVYDIWVEEWNEISQVDIEITPVELYEISEKRCSSILDKMQTNAKLNNHDITDLWEPHTDYEPDSTGSFDISESKIAQIEESASEFDTIEEGLVESLLDSDTILQIAQDIAKSENRDIGRWVIEDGRHKVQKLFWNENRGVLANLSVSYTPSKINEALTDLTVESVNAYVSSEPQEKQKSTNQTPNSQSDAIGEFFK